MIMLMCTFSLQIIFTVSSSYHFTLWPHLILYLSYHLCLNGCNVGSSLSFNRHHQRRLNSHCTLYSIRFNFPATMCIERIGEEGVRVCRIHDSVCVIHICTFSKWINIFSTRALTWNVIRTKPDWMRSTLEKHCEKKEREKKWIAPPPTVFFFFLFFLHSLMCFALCEAGVFFFCAAFFVSKYWFDQNELSAIAIVKFINNGFRESTDSPNFTPFLAKRSTSFRCTHLVAPGAADVLKEQIYVAQWRCQLIFVLRLDGCLGRLVHNTTFARYK